MKLDSYKIKLRGIVGNTTAVPTKIAWITGSDSCLATPCYKENDYIVVELIPDCVGDTCIEGYIQFGDTCANCDPLYFKRCFCSVDTDCPSGCENCNQYGICQSKCLINEFCVGDQCCNCDANTPCTGNKICNGCKCVCPQGTFDDNGICVECNSTTVLDKCHKCVNGAIIATPCDGKCDPATGGCVDCLTGGDCSFRTDGKTCCDNKQCVCCKGTVWSTELQTCVPQPCASDEECGDPCLKCTPEGCKPITCPAGYKCYKGECVYWPCISTSCDNGADCGPDCGCVEFEGVKQCVPCHILECEGLCELALGCECKGNNVCGGIDNCGQYCDGNTPCLDSNCTCYNNRCVSCKNFPCTDAEGGCSSYYNCGCSDTNTCEGGRVCKDKLTLTKKEDCTAEAGCVLEGQFTSENMCGCDNIQFKTKILPSTGSQTTFVKIQSKMYKNGIEYTKFKTSDIFGDDELVTATISTTITYDVKNEFGFWVSANVTDTLGTKTVTNTNTIPDIEITNAQVKKLINNVPTRATIKVNVQNVKVNSNGCVSYDAKELGTFIFDFSLPAISITQIINSYSTEQVTVTNDNINKRKPLFIWYKSTDGNYSTNEFINDGVYNRNGYFRKQYVSLVGGKYTDSINSPSQGLWANYMYLLKVDCGCLNKTGVTTEGALVYCCPKDYNVKFDDCNTKVTISSFSVCNVNGDLSKASILTPTQSQTKYKILVAKGSRGSEEIDLIYTATNRIGEKIITSPGDPITSIRIVQVYEGGLLDGPQCFKEYGGVNVDLPELDFKTDCEFSATKIKVSVPQTTGAALRIGQISFISGTKPNEVSLLAGAVNTNGIYNAEIPKKISGGQSVFPLVAKVTFTDGTVSQNYAGCVKYFNIPDCSVTNDLEIQGRQTSNKNCAVDKTGVTIKSTPGFFDNSLPIEYTFTGGDLENPLIITNTTGSATFTNLGAGIYTGTAVQGTTVATSTITVVEAINPEVFLSPSTICQGQSSSIVINAIPGSSFTVYNPTGGIIGSPIIGQSGTTTITNINTEGTYRVILNNNIDDMYCFPYSINLDLTQGGEPLNPTLTFQAGTYCVGQPIPFRIFDDGKNKTYNLSTTNGFVTSPLQASIGNFNGEYIPSSTSGSISILSSTSTCDSMTPVLVTTPTTGVSISTGPVIGTPSISCVTGLHTVSVNITGATSVTIGGVVIVPTGTLYTRTGITGTSSINIIATNGSCSITEPVVLQSCDCPSYEAIIGISASTCGQGSQTIFFTGYTPNLINVAYQLQEYSQGQWWNVAGESGTFLAPTPEFTVNNQVNNPVSYRVVFDDGTCTEETNIVETSVISEPTVTITSSSPNPVSTNTPFTLTANVGNVTPGTPITYLWSGLGASGQTTQSVTLGIPNSGSQSYSVTVTVGSCAPIVANYTVNVNQTCNMSIGITNNIGQCANPTATASGGSGPISYVWSIVDGAVLATTATLDGGLVTPVGTPLFLSVTATDGNGCTVTTTIPYTRCAGGCNCDYEINVVDDVTGLPAISTFDVVEEGGKQSIAARLRREVTKTCQSGGVPIVDALVTVPRLGLLSSSITLQMPAGSVITSVDLVINNVLTTVAVTGINQTDINSLISFLNTTVSQANFFTLTSTGAGFIPTIAHIISNTNVNGFDVTGSYTNNAVATDYTFNNTYITNIHGNYATPSCGTVSYYRTVTPNISGLIIAKTYNSLSITSSGTYTPVSNPSDPSNTLSCNGCN